MTTGQLILTILGITTVAAIGAGTTVAVTKETAQTDRYIADRRGETSVKCAEQGHAVPQCPSHIATANLGGSGGFRFQG